MTTDATAELATLIGTALAHAATNRDELRAACLSVVAGGERTRERFGAMVAAAALAALHEHSIRPTPDPLAAAESAFGGKAAQR